MQKGEEFRNMLHMRTTTALRLSFKVNFKSTGFVVAVGCALVSTEICVNLSHAMHVVDGD